MFCMAVIVATLECMKAQEALRMAEFELGRLKRQSDELRTIDVEARFIDDPLLLTDCLV